MTWVAQELTTWLFLAFALGVLAGVLLSLTRVTVEKWVEVPVEAAPEPDTATSETAEAEAPVDTGPEPEAEPVFPLLEGEEAPWQHQEAWSRPATPVRSSHAGARELDEWDDAAANWRTWADEATGRESQPEEPLPGGGRRVAGGSPVAEPPPAYEAPPVAEDPFPGAPEPDPFPVAPRRDAAAFDRVPDEDLFAADRAADGGPEPLHDDAPDEVEPVAAPVAVEPVAPDLVVPPPSPVSDAELFAADRAVEPAAPAEPEPVDVFPVPEPEPEPVDVFPVPEPAPEAEPEPEPEPEAEPTPPRVEQSPFDAAAGGFVRKRRSKLLRHEQSEPEPVAEMSPEPVAELVPEPEPVFPSYEPEPEPEPEPVAQTFPTYEPEPEPVDEVTPEHEPVAGARARA